MVAKQKFGKEHWLPNFRPHKVSSANPSSSLEFLWVLDLNHGNHWNVSLMNEFFSPVEISVIKSIQIRDEPYQDRWVWQFTFNEG